MKKIFKNLLGISLGSALVATSISVFIVPHRLISGGISGLSLIVFYLTSIPISLLIFIFNIPIVILGAKQLGKTFTLYSIFGITMMSTMIFVFRNIPPIASAMQTPTQNSLLAAIYAGVITGIGGGIVFRSGGTLGGTDILGMIIKKRFNLSIGNFLLYSNVVIMIISLIFFKPEIVMFTLISMYVASTVTDMVQEGVNTKTTVLIISDKYEIIAEQILKTLHRGVTYLHAEGGFLHNEKKVIMCVTTKFELARLKDLTLKADPFAFISISETKEVFGKGF
ncbi:MAG: YitT family protein [Deltaproteobacteria bacterium]